MTRKEVRILRAAFNEDFVKPLQELSEFLLEDHEKIEKINQEKPANE